VLTLQELFDDLASGALGNLNMVDPKTQEINSNQYSKLVSYVNLALLALHKRFLLKTGEVVIQLHPNMVKYPLRKKYARSNSESTEPIKFIIDSEHEPFKEDIIKIEQVFSELNEELPINDSNQCYPVFTPEPDVISALPTSGCPMSLHIVYRAKHPKIVVNPLSNLADINIHIPDFILDALYSRIAAYTYKAISGDETEGSAARSYLYQYELECKRIEIDNVTADDNNQFNIFGEKGWV